MIFLYVNLFAFLFSLSDSWFFFADVKTAVKNKVPLVRSMTLNWLNFCIETSNKSVIQKAHKDYVPVCMEVSE